MKKSLSVGDIAEATGVTVRTLHHYEEIGLLVASSRNEGGHRVYSASDLKKLQQILSLRQIGFSLDEIRTCLLEGSRSPLEIVRLHQKRVRDERENLSRLQDKLTALEQTLAANKEPSVQELLITIEVIQMHDKYFTKEQLEEIKNRRDAFGEEKFQNAWPRLIEKVRAEAKNGTDPSSPQVQMLAAEWNSLIEAFTGGNAGIRMQLSSMYRNEPAARERAGMDPELTEYVAKMMSFFVHQKK